MAAVSLARNTNIIFIDLIQFYLICQMLAKFSGVETERTVPKLRKRIFLYCVHLLHKEGYEMYKKA